MGTWILLLNQDGKRFCDEIAGGAEGSGYQAPRQPTGVYVSFADANWEDVTCKVPPCHNAVDFSYDIPYELTIGAIEQIMAGIEPAPAANDRGVFYANTIEELIDLMGVYTEEQKAVALESIARYNELAAAGYDSDFGSDARIMKPLDTPPFYAAYAQTDSVSAGLVQVTGLDVNDDYQVLDNTQRPIPGLYAIGNSAGNRYIVAYSTPIAGMSLGYTLTEGMLCGAAVASL